MERTKRLEREPAPRIKEPSGNQFITLEECVKRSLR